MKIYKKTFFEKKNKAFKFIKIITNKFNLKKIKKKMFKFSLIVILDFNKYSIKN